MFGLLALRMLQTSLRYGVCSESAFGFAAYGFLMIKVFDDIKNADRFGEIAMHLLKIFTANKCSCEVIIIVYGLIKPLVEHLHKCTKMLEYSYELGMQSGKIYFAMMSLVQQYRIRFLMGENLVTIEKKLMASDEEMMEHRQEMFRLSILPLRQACQNLIGHSDDPEELTGEVMNEEQFLLKVRG
eukprot:13874913-Ditylum_brightwellii.AAC.1